MRDHGYPPYETHKAEHDLLLRQVIDPQPDFASDLAAVADKIVNFIRS